MLKLKVLQQFLMNNFFELIYNINSGNKYFIKNVKIRYTNRL